MGTGTETPKYKVIKRDQKRVVAKAESKKKPVVFVCNEVLKEMWLHADEEKLAGTLTFQTKSGKEIKRVLAYTWFVPGIWKVKIDSKDCHLAEPVSAEGVDPVMFNRVQQLYKENTTLFLFKVEGDAEIDQVVECLLSSAKGKEVPIRVTYAAIGGDGGTTSIPVTPLSDDYISELQNEPLAIIYLILLEHFAGLSISESVAAGGITRKEYQLICRLKPKNPDFTPQTVARILTQAYHEFQAIPKAQGEHLIFMAEAILYQRKRKNILAMNNQLQIAEGLMRDEKGKFSTDFGIKRRGASTLLLYDKFGRALPAYVGFMDVHYRNIDLDKVPSIKITVGVDNSAHMLQVLEQTFAFPTRETYVFLSSWSDFQIYIVNEVHRLYGGEIGKKIVAMLPMAIGFFVVHAIVGAMARRGNPYAAAILVIAKAAGWVMNVDMGIATLKKMNVAGYHYGMMEKIHRRSPKETSKETLTQLSKYHLELGTRALIDAMSEVIAMGVFVAGGIAGKRLAGSLAKNIKANKSEARVELKFENDKVSQIKSLKGQSKIEVQTEQNAGAIGNPKKPNPKVESPKTHDTPPLEESALNSGRRQKSKAPKPSERVPVMDYNYKTTDAQGRPASSEAVTGMPENHLGLVKQVAAQIKSLVLLRTTNPRGVQHIRSGHPPKGKELIALNTDAVTGKVTIRNKSQAKIAHEKGYYILAADGYAYGKGWKTRLKGPDGKDVKFDMGAKGEYGELTHRPGQVIDPKARKAVVGDYDVQDVIPIDAQTRNLAAVPEKVSGDVVSPAVRKFMNAFNELLRLNGDIARIVHGADAQFMQYLKVRKAAFKSDAIGVLPDGRVVFIGLAELEAFYAAIGRFRLQLPGNVQLGPYKGSN